MSEEQEKGYLEYQNKKGGREDHGWMWLRGVQKEMTQLATNKDGGMVEGQREAKEA